MARVAPEERTRQLLAAALQEFAERGYAGARMSAIAQAAGVAEGTVYLYFRNKKSLLYAVVESGVADYLAALEEALASAASAPEELAALIRFHLAYLGARPHLARVTQVELRQPDPETRREVYARLTPFFRRLDAILARGRAEGSLRDDVDPRVARRMVFGTLDECVSAWVMARHPYPLAALAEDVVRLIWGGIRA